MEFTGAQIVIKVLLDLGVTDVFGYVGNSVLPIFDALSNSNIKFYQSVSEIGASHAADGYSRASSKTGVVLATSGPGATNLMTGIATAYMDSVPLVAITANVPLSGLGKDSFQEVDTGGIATPITKFSCMVKSIDTLEYDLKLAFCVAQSGRKGAVLVDIPYNVLKEHAPYKGLTVPPLKMPTPSTTALAQAARYLNDSKRPVILVGGGATAATNEVALLSDALGAPIVSTMTATPSVDHQNYIGMIGSFAEKQNNLIYDSGDLIVALGTRFSDKMYGSIGKGKRFVHVDIDAAELGKVITDAVFINGDAQQVLKSLLPLIEPKDAVWFEHPQRAQRSDGLHRLTTQIANINLKDTIVATDVGNHQIALLASLAYKPHNEIITSAGLGTMGFGLGAAIGAHIATGKRVLLLSGDGSFNMSYNELSTLAKYKLPITVVIANNRSLKMIEDLQRKKYNRKYIGIDTPAINYAALAKALGVKGINCPLNKAQTVIEAALDGGKPVVIDVKLR